MEESADEIAEVGLNPMDLYGDDALAYIEEQIEVFSGS
jgi:hypothetical protein